MNNVVTNFQQILAQASQLGLPMTKQRGIVREYLQCKFVHDLYRTSSLTKLSFVGGTSLRLLRNLPRFSEDLDFDNLGLNNSAVASLFAAVVRSWHRENIEVELHEQRKDTGSFAELRFPQLLYQLKISTNPKEKLMIKLDYASWWQGQQFEVEMLNRFGFIEQVTTNPLNQLLVQKLTAYVRRTQTQPRDIYDAVWLYAQGARIDLAFAKANNLDDLLSQVVAKFEQERIPSLFERRLAPFLFDEVEVGKLHLFGKVIRLLQTDASGVGR